MSSSKKRNNQTKNIKNYNELLKSIDRESRIKQIDSNIIDKKCNNTEKNSTETNNINKIPEKKKIDNLNENIYKEYKKNILDTPFFSGIITTEKINDYQDPNEYSENNKQKQNICDIPKLSLKMPEDNTESPIMRESCIRKIIKKVPKFITETVQDSEPFIIKEVINIDAEINNIEDILKLIDTYKNDKSIKYNINIEALHKIKEPLLELNSMIGMKELKNSIVDQIIYFIQGLHKNINNTGDFMHTVIYGPPGTGKTEIAKIMGKIYSKIGLLNRGTFRKVTRNDLIAGYLGQTALKTKDVISECLGGVLFIDEAYSLGNSDSKDIFSKECIDVLCESLSDNKENLMVIIAGYENELNDCFFSCNQGLDSRFVWRFKTDDYKPEDLYNIFLKKVLDIGWVLQDNSGITIDWFKKNVDYFKFYGRDIETLLSKTKIAHSKRVFCKSEDDKKKITIKDIDKGLELFLKNENVKKRKEKESMNRIISSIYV